MVSALDVAQYILKQSGAMTTWKLQKLVYYSQAWSLVWDDVPLFPERIEAWANGPVVPDLYQLHRGNFTVDRIAGGNPTALSDDERETIDAVLGTYGDRSPQWLSDLTHGERPWRDARDRAGLALGERGSEQITLEEMAEYYGGLE